MNKIKKNDQLLSVVKALANASRIKILRQLLEGPSCVNMTKEEINISQPNLSQHLKVLKNAGLIECRKEMTKHCYYLKKAKLVKKLLAVLEKISLENM